MQGRSVVVFVVATLAVACTAERAAREEGSGPGAPALAEEPSPPPAPLSAWIEIGGERSDLDHVAAFRMERCPGDFVTWVLMANRPIDLQRLVTPLAPSESLDSAWHQLTVGDAWAVISPAASAKPFLTVERRTANGRDHFSGPRVDDPEGPALRIDDGERIAGTWRGATNESSWRGDPGTFELTFDTAVSPTWLGGEELPADGGEPGRAAAAYLTALAAGDSAGVRRNASDGLVSWPGPDAGDDAMADVLEYLAQGAPTEWEIGGGRSDGSRAYVGWVGEALYGTVDEGLVFLERQSPREGGAEGRWVVDSVSPCVRFGG